MHNQPRTTYASPSPPQAGPSKLHCIKETQKARSPLRRRLRHRPRARLPPPQAGSRARPAAAYPGLSGGHRQSMLPPPHACRHRRAATMWPVHSPCFAGRRTWAGGGGQPGGAQPPTPRPTPSERGCKPRSRTETLGRVTAGALRLRWVAGGRKNS